MAPGKTHRLEPNQILKVNDEIQIMHLGYGHRMTDEGDRPFFEFQVTGPREFARSQSSRVWYKKSDKTTMDFGAVRLVFTKCEDNGPPHKKDAGVEFRIEPIRAVAAGEKFELKLGEAVFVGNELGVSVLSFGHDDDDDGGDTIADLSLNTGKIHQSQMIFHKAHKGKTVDWQNWEIEYTGWKNQGPPHGPDQSIELIVRRKTK